MKFSLRNISSYIATGLLSLISSCLPGPSPQPTPTGPVFYDWSQLVAGADLSSVNMVEAAGGVYTDSSKVKDPFVLFRQHGCNVARVRLFKNPQAAGGYNANGFGGIQDVVHTLQRAKAQGMAVILDLHFSDTWADPGNQKTPEVWNGLALGDLKDSVYNYVKSVLNVMKNRGLTPEMIQLGNEIQPGMLLPVGSIGTNDFTSLAALLNSGIKAVRDFSSGSTIKPLIILHPGQPDVAEWWCKGIQSKGVTDYDIIGLSYYEEYSSITMADLSHLIPTWKNEFAKKILIVETSYQWTNASQDGNVYHAQVVKNGFEVSPAGQSDYMVTLTQNAVSGTGMGVVVWEPAWISNQQNWGQETIAFFDFTGHAQKAIDFFTFNYLF